MGKKWNPPATRGAYGDEDIQEAVIRIVKAQRVCDDLWQAMSEAQTKLDDAIENVRYVTMNAHGLPAGWPRAGTTTGGMNRAAAPPVQQRRPYSFDDGVVDKTDWETVRTAPHGGTRTYTGYGDGYASGPITPVWSPPGKKAGGKWVNGRYVEPSGVSADMGAAVEAEVHDMRSTRTLAPRPTIDAASVDPFWLGLEDEAPAVNAAPEEPEPPAKTVTQADRQAYLDACTTAGLSGAALDTAIASFDAAHPVTEGGDA